MKNKCPLIPTTEIIWGIMESLFNARRIERLAKRILEDEQIIGIFTLKEHHIKYPIVLFYYAIEEFGKAILLEGEIDIAIFHKLSHIQPIWWFNHNHKIRAVQVKYPELRIDREKSNDEIIENFHDRSNLLLTDYNEKGWGNNPLNIEQEDICKKIEQLDELIDQMQNRFRNIIKINGLNRNNS